MKKVNCFFSGYTGYSGYIDGIVIPCPKRKSDYLNGVAINKIIASHPNYQDVEIKKFIYMTELNHFKKLKWYQLHIY